MNKEIRFVQIEDIETREDGDKRYLSGYANKWEKLSENLGGFQEKFQKGAFSKSLMKRKVMAFWNHNDDIVLGNTESKTLTISEDDRGLKFELELPDTQAARDARILIKRGDVTGMSFAFRATVDEWDESGKVVVRTVKEADLFEISPTPLPAYNSSTVKARSEANDNVYNKFKETRDNNFQRLYKIRENVIKNISL